MARKRRNLSRRSRQRRASKKSFKAICASCGRELMMEIPPPKGKELLCLDCYKK